ncbi:TIR-like protein FxsC [Dactylosporangium sp. CA-139066]|uniref:TIR-like protein FxsC n=1 Tax=Dactylosporangium sp. CA-139066 TaxID=3239930 RepID=UPI003D93A950
MTTPAAATNRLDDVLGTLPPRAVELAYHAALPVAVDVELLHLLRINFLDDLDWETEARLLLSPLFRELGEGLYEIEPDLRSILLIGLNTRFGEERLRRVALLLEQYCETLVWDDSPSLDFAQRLTALHVLDPARAEAWLASNTAHDEDADLGDPWYVAMRGHLDRPPADVTLDDELAAAIGRLDAARPGARTAAIRAVGAIGALPGVDPDPAVETLRDVKATGSPPESSQAERLLRRVSTTAHTRAPRPDPDPDQIAAMIADFPMGGLTDETGRRHLRQILTWLLTSDQDIFVAGPPWSGVDTLRRMLEAELAAWSARHRPGVGARFFFGNMPAGSSGHMLELEAQPGTQDYLGRVFDQNGTVTGACFQIEPGVLATAWNVVAAAGAEDVGDEVLIGAQAGYDTATAVVVAADRPRDVAVLRCDVPLPASAPGLAVPSARSGTKYAGDLAGSPVLRRIDGSVVGITVHGIPGMVRKWVGAEHLDPLLEGVAETRVRPTPAAEVRDREAPPSVEDLDPAAPVFFVSYARPRSPQPAAPTVSNRVVNFFHELSLHLNNLVYREAGADPGYLDVSQDDTGDYPSRSLEALGSCQVFVPLLSPAYPRSRWCALEWNAFTSRAVRSRENESPTRSTSILPVLWTSTLSNFSQMPDAIRNIQFFYPSRVGRSGNSQQYTEDGLYGMLASNAPGTDEVIFRLAQRIVEIYQSNHVGPLTTDPADLPSVIT